MKKPNSWLALCRRLGTPPNGFQLAWSRHVVFNDDLIWFANCLWGLFDINLSEGKNEMVLRDMVASHGKVRTAQFFVWWRDNLGDRTSLEQMQGSGFIEHFDGRDALTLDSDEELANILASHGM